MCEKLRITNENIDQPHTLEAFADYLQASYSTVFRMLGEGKIEAHKVRGTWRVNVPASLKMLGLSD